MRSVRHLSYSTRHAGYGARGGGRAAVAERRSSTNRHVYLTAPCRAVRFWALPLRGLHHGSAGVISALMRHSNTSEGG